MQENYNESSNTLTYLIHIRNENDENHTSLCSSSTFTAYFHQQNVCGKHLPYLLDVSSAIGWEHLLHWWLLPQIRSFLSMLDIRVSTFSHNCKYTMTGKSCVYIEFALCGMRCLASQHVWSSVCAWQPLNRPWWFNW